VTPFEVGLLVIAKEPVPGRVKTRLCPPCTPEQAADLAAAALADTLAAVGATPAAARTLVIDGGYPAPAGWETVAQHGNGLGERLAHAFADTAVPGRASLLVGMDTPQLTPELLGHLIGLLGAGTDAVVAPALDGGWWALALRDPRHAAVLTTVPMSTCDTGTATIAALRAVGCAVTVGPALGDVDYAADALAVAAAHPGGRFAALVRAYLPMTGTATAGSVR
jgi:uncharacterized protein